MQLEIKDILTIIGFIVAFVGGQLTSRAQSRLEYKKWIRARQDDVRRDIRIAVADVAEKLAGFAHSMMWVTYNLSSDNVFKKDRKAMIGAHHQEAHEFISRLVGSQIRLAALDIDTYRKVTPLISEAINLSEEVLAAIDQSQQNSQRSRQALHDCNGKALTFIKGLPEQIGNTIGLDSLVPDTTKSRSKG